MKYDVTVEKWIPVRMLNGERKKISLLELFKTAHEIQQLEGLNVMEEYSVYRFLTLFLMAVYLPEDIIDVEDILDDGKIDMEKVDKYLDLCRQEGVSFDVFDEQRPFLQSPYDAKYDKDNNIKSIAVLDKTMPSGNNAVHFDHTLESNAIMPVDKAICSLLAAQIFCTAAAQGYPSNVNGAPPLFFIPKGQNLFETLILSLRPLRMSKEPDKNDLELWRNPQVVVPKEKVTKTSVFYGMLFPSRRIRLIGEEGCLLKRCYYQQGLNFIGYDSWTDFYVAYYFDKKGRHSLKPSLEKELWRNMGTIYSLAHQDISVNNTLSVVRQYEEIMKNRDKTEMPMLSFGAVTNQSAYIDLQRGEITLNTCIADKIEKVDAVTEAIKKAEEVASYLMKSMILMVRNIVDRKDYRKSDINQAVHDYYGACELRFYEFCGALAVAETEEDRQTCMEEWEMFLKKSAIKFYNQFSDVICTTAKELKAAEKAKSYLLAKLNMNGRG